MNITTNRAEDKIYMIIEGRIDTNTSAQLQSEILNAFQKTSNIVLDFAKVDYVSSAGLRALLIGQKTATSKNGSMELMNVSDMVMSVFEMTGFKGILKFR